MGFSWQRWCTPIFNFKEDTLGLTAKSGYELALNAFGGVLYYLQKCLIDFEVLSMKNFEIYKPVDNLIGKEFNSIDMRKKIFKQKYMVILDLEFINSLFK